MSTSSLSLGARGGGTAVTRFSKPHEPLKPTGRWAPRPEPKTEIERYLRSQPETSAAVIGAHGVPAMPPMHDPPPPPKDFRQQQLDGLRSSFPNSSSREYGFHKDFAEGRASEVGSRTAAALLRPALPGVQRVGEEGEEPRAARKPEPPTRATCRE